MMPAQAIMAFDDAVRWLMKAATLPSFAVAPGVAADGKPCVFVRGEEEALEFPAPVAAALGRSLVDIMEKYNCTDADVGESWRRAGPMLLKVAQIN